jgi:hypothetical protein
MFRLRRLTKKRNARAEEPPGASRFSSLFNVAAIGGKSPRVFSCEGQSRGIDCFRQGDRLARLRRGGSARGSSGEDTAAEEGAFERAVAVHAASTEARDLTGRVEAMDGMSVGIQNPG